jgi:hypothetical protein
MHRRTHLPPTPAEKSYITPAVAKVDEEQSAPPDQATWQPGGGGRPQMTPG